MADFTLDEDQQQIQDMVRKFAQNEIRPIARDCDEEAAFPDELMTKTWELGLCANTIPEEYDGFGLERSAVTSAIIAEELAWGDLSLALGLLTPMTVMIPVLEFGTDDQKKEWLPKFTGETPYYASAALMEPGLGFSPFKLKTTVTIDGDKLVLNGRKCMAPLADRAEQLLVYASRNDGSGKVDAVMVDRSAEGMTIGDREKNLGLNSLPLFPVTLDNCRVPANRLIGGENGVNYTRLLNISRAITAAMGAGMGRASMEYARDYARERTAFGEPIAGRQSVAFMIAEAALEVDAVRLMAWKAAWRVDRNEDATRDAALARMYAGSQIMKVADYGVQVLGGHGYIREHPVEMWFRNGRAVSILEGLALG